MDIITKRMHRIEAKINIIAKALFMAISIGAGALTYAVCVMHGYPLSGLWACLAVVAVGVPLERKIAWVERTWSYDSTE